MHQRLAAGNRDHRRPQRAQFVDAPVHLGKRDWLREIVELVAVGTGEIAPPHRNDVGQQGMIRRSQGPRHHLRPAQIAVERLGMAAHSCQKRRHL